jgi:flavin reductase (DIM6/NTAB) family NADH-FMN oxidoreductase RutF
MSETIAVAAPTVPPPVSVGDYRGLMATFPTGVAVVTTADIDGKLWGATCSSICSVTLSPPTLLVCIREQSPTLQALLRRRSFAVNLLHRSAQRTAELFASADPERFARVRIRNTGSEAGPHLTDDAHAIADCHVAGTVPVGDHVIVLGRVSRVTGGGGQPHPLLYGLRTFAAWPTV